MLRQRIKEFVNCNFIYCNITDSLTAENNLESNRDKRY